MLWLAIGFGLGHFAGWRDGRVDGMRELETAIYKRLAEER